MSMPAPFAAPPAALLAATDPHVTVPIELIEALVPALRRVSGSPKELARLTRRNEETMKNLLEGRNAPSGVVLIDLIRRFDEVFLAVLALAGRAPVQLTERQMAAAQQALALLVGSASELNSGPTPSAKPTLPTHLPPTIEDKEPSLCRPMPLKQTTTTPNPPAIGRRPRPARASCRAASSSKPIAGAAAALSAAYLMSGSGLASSRS